MHRSSKVLSCWAVFMPMHACPPSHFSQAQLFATPWTVAHPLSMGFSRQEYWSGMPFPSPGDLPNPGIKPSSPALQADSLPSQLPMKGRGDVYFSFVFP